MKALLYWQDRLLILQKKDREGLKPWELPGGGLDFGEKPAEALMREVQEETGLTMDFICPVATWCYRREAHINLVGMICLCMAHDDKVVLSNEHLDYRWVLPSELRNYTLHQSLMESLREIDADKLMQAQKLMRVFSRDFV